ncbi:MAG: hypothetical protein ACE5D0_02540 [Fidelibacterota bacterium]
MEYKTFFILAATLALFLSIMLLAAPKALIKTSEVMNKSIDSSQYYKKNRVLFGILTILLGCLMLYLVI